jgi:hypothetical protein
LFTARGLGNRFRFHVMRGQKKHVSVCGLRAS